MNTVTISAPGKLMLLGEHAVIYGKPCLVTAVDSRLAVTATKTQELGLTIDAPQSKDTRFITAALDIFKKSVGITNGHTGLSITTASPFSGKYGFGSSSAVTVATIAALAKVYEKNLSPHQIFDIAYEVVLAVQKTGSGFDLAAAAYGGTLYFKKVEQ